MELLGVPEDWNEYYNIDVNYSNGTSGYVPYPGHNGNPYVAYGSGAYMFTFSIKSGINVSATNPNVVWQKKSGETEVPMKDEAEDVPEEAAIAAIPEDSTPIAAVLEEEEEPAIEVVELQASTKEEITTVAVKEVVEQVEVKATEEKEEVSVIQQVCDTIKKLVCGAEVHLNSSRKYGMRGTL